MENDWSWLVALTDSNYRPVDAASIAESIPSRWKALVPGVVALGCGNTTRAMQALEEAYRGASEQGDAALALVATSLGSYSEVQHFNLYPGGAGADSVDVNLRWDGSAAAARFSERAVRAQRLPGGKEAHAAQRWLEFATMRTIGLAIIRSGVGTPFASEMLELQSNQCVDARQQAAVIGPAAVSFVERALAEVYAAGGDARRAHEIIDASIAESRAAGDTIGVAAALALRGDLIAAPLSSGLVGNLWISESGAIDSGLRWDIEVREMARPQDCGAASESWNEALALLRDVGSPRGEGAILLRLAHLATLEDRPADAVPLIDQASERFTRAAHAMHVHLAKARCALAHVDLHRRSADRGAAVAIGEWGRTTGSFSYAVGLGLLFTRAGRQCQLRLGDAEKAEACFQLALALNESLGAHQRSAQTHADLATLYRELGYRDRASAELESALDAIAGDPLIKSQRPPIVGERGAMLIQKLYLESLEHRDFAGMRSAVARIDQFGAILSVGGLAVMALQNLTRTQSDVLIPLYEATAARNDGRAQDAERLFARALAAAEHKEGTQRDYLVATVQGTWYHFEHALHAWDRYRNAAGDGGGPADLRSMLAALLKRMSPDMPEEAKRDLWWAEAENFSFFVRVKAFPRAAESLARLVALAGERWWSEDSRPWCPLSDIGEMHEGLGDLGAALRHYEQAIAVFEQRRAFLSRDELKTALGADFGAQYLFVQAARAALAKAASAPTVDDRRDAQRRTFEFSERGRARALLDLLAANVNAHDGTTSEPPDIERWRELSGKSQLWAGMLARARGDAQADVRLSRELEARLHACDDELRALEEKIATRYPEIGLTAGAAQVAGLDEISRLLGPDTAVLEYMSVGSELLLWAITCEGMAAPMRREVPPGLLARSARSFRDGCSGGERLDRLEALAAPLVEHLISPLASVIETHERLILVPHGDLHLVPFAALRWKARWLGDDHVLTYLPSASMLPLLRRPRDPATETALVVGNPADMSHVPPFENEAQNLVELPAAEGEARAVAGLLGGKLLIGPQATVANTKAELTRRRVLHFATHGMMYADAPLLSGIALADGQVLNLYELMALRLRADLVTLSACNTALGVQTGGDEVVGLTRGLLAAGARAALVTLWPIFDGSTAVLMSHFYQRVRSGEDAASALNAAQRVVRTLSTKDLNHELAVLRDSVQLVARPMPEGGAHPKHWAAFVLVGDNHK